MDQATAVVRALSFGIAKTRHPQHRAHLSETHRISAAPARQNLGSVVAVSGAMTEIFSVVGRLAPTDVTVTLTGETGTGKDVFAHLLHELSPRVRQPFVVFDCGAVPANLMESELFGHERGAFTGAHAEHPGAFERAAGGTLFLDEIGELPLELQPRLLRALDNRSIRRVGGTKDRHVDVRIVAATNRDLGGLVAAKQFRQDLYFRLAAAVVTLPPLRDRLDDMTVLVPRLLADLRRPDVRASEGTIRRAAGAPLARQRPRAQERHFLCAGLRRGEHPRTAAPPVHRAPGGRLGPGTIAPRRTLAADHRARGHPPDAAGRARKQGSGRARARHRAVYAVREAS